VARDIARALGANERRDGFFHGGGWVVTWAIGHLVALSEPHEINPAWKRWRRADLPILPAEWPLKVYDRTHDQFEIVRRVLNSPKIDRIVCATDAGREGELIFRYIYEAAKSTKPVERLWISSLTPEAITKGFSALRPGAEFDALAAAARARSRADWLVGMNLSRAYSLDYDGGLSVGRVQTPTLAMLVERELAIRDFRPEDYREVVATFALARAKEKYRGTWFVEKLGEDGKRERATRLPADGVEAKAIVARAKTGDAKVESVERETKRSSPPPLYDLTELQRHGNRIFGFRAERTLDLAQALYEKHKLITYPRTDSRHLSSDVAKDLPRIVDAVRGPYDGLLAESTGSKPLGKRFVDDRKVTDHHAIIPTGKRSSSLDPGSDEHKIYDLICRRLLAAWQKPHVWAVTNVVTLVVSPDVEDRFFTTGTAIEQEGWKALDPKPPKRAAKKDAAEEEQVPPGLTSGEGVAVEDVKSIEKKTRPPRRFNEATLLTAMESAGRTLEEKELSDAMKESGLGTPATRAATIETLVKREYIVRRGKALEATDKAVRLIEVVHPKVKSPAMTGEWEARLKAIERGEGGFERFMSGIEDYVREVVGSGPQPTVAGEEEVPLPPEPPPPEEFFPEEYFEERPPFDPAFDAPPLLAETAARAPAGGSEYQARQAERRFGQPQPLFEAMSPAASPEPKREPVAKEGLDDLLRESFGFDSFRPHQRELCEAAIEGRDALLVMPTGAGKSLCYQLPALARAGTGLVVSPLIALMEDQVAKLRERGLNAERIHSGRDRESARQVCADYLAGRLDFLFIAPERLAVPGFPEMLAKRKPALTAIDEAHCISEWGHDFRPEYRMLGERLPLLRPAPVIAATATATPRVQGDIVAQLGLPDPLLSIHGFRRENIAVEVVELTPSQRPPAVLKILKEPNRRPAIIYAPTRKEAERQAEELRPEFPAAAYHAGLPAAQRDRVQVDFLAGKLDVIIATIAFGMGVDKANVRTVIHTGLSGSVEGYYQEIGRAGRDGAPSRAILMHSWNDRRTHEFFQQRDYPDISELTKIYQSLSDEPVRRDQLESRLGMDPQVFEKALEKLWIHKGALVDPDETVRRGRSDWRGPYNRQAQHRLAQLQAISRYTETHECRMLTLVRHFGDQEDSQKPCGICDVCAPEACLVMRRREPTAGETKALEALLAELGRRDNQSIGRLFRECFEGTDVDRKAFDRLVVGLARAGYIGLVEDSFEKDGRVIEFRRISLTHEGRTHTGPIAPYVMVEVEAPKAERKRSRKSGTRASGTRARKGAAARARAADASNADPLLLEALRAWRLSEARRRRLPAFQIFSNATLGALAAARPSNESELLGIKGVGPTLVKRYGDKLIAIVSNVSAS